MNTHTTRRSSTGHPILLPAANNAGQRSLLPLVPTRAFLSWTFGRGSVIWRIWPAVLLHTLFAAAVVSVSLKTRVKLGIPNIMLTVLGVVIGFVISYRASSGYDRYWAGRSAWSDVMRTSRTLCRLIWFHIPLRLPAYASEESPEHTVKEKERSREVRRVMAEKRMALDLVEAYSVSLKHHLRGEMGIYYEDLYDLVRPLHDHSQHQSQQRTDRPGRQSPEPMSPEHAPATSESTLIPSDAVASSTGYGTFTTEAPNKTSSDTSSLFSHRSIGEETQLFPGATRKRGGVITGVSGDLIPFSSLVSAIVQGIKSMGGMLFGRKQVGEDEVNRPRGGSQRWEGTGGNGSQSILHIKHRPLVAGGGENIPLEVIRSLTVWLSILEQRGTVPGSSLGGMFTCLAAFEDSLSVLERILTTPLPFVFSVHIRTVWLYLFFLPFQLVDQFHWYTIPGVTIAAFIYLGFVASGEEIEQPFGYDENDLDLDMFCKQIIHADIEHLKKTPCPNVLLGSHHDEDVSIDKVGNLTRGEHCKVDDVFGRHSVQS